MADTNEKIDTTTQTEQQGNESSAVDSTTETTNTNVGTEKLFTQDDIDKIITKRFAKEKIKAEAEKAEAEKLATMSAEEKAKFELDKQKLEFEIKQKEFAKQQMELQVTKELSTKGLSLEFVNFCMADTAEQSFKNINNLQKIINENVEKMVKERLKGGYTPPKTEVKKEIDPFLKAFGR